MKKTSISHAIYFFFSALSVKAGNVSVAAFIDSAGNLAAVKRIVPYFKPLMYPRLHSTRETLAGLFGAILNKFLIETKPSLNEI